MPPQLDVQHKLLIQHVHWRHSHRNSSQPLSDHTTSTGTLVTGLKAGSSDHVSDSSGFLKVRKYRQPYKALSSISSVSRFCKRMEAFKVTRTRTRRFRSLGCYTVSNGRHQRSAFIFRLQSMKVLPSHYGYFG